MDEFLQTLKVNKIINVHKVFKAFIFFDPTTFSCCYSTLFLIILLLLVSHKHRFITRERQELKLFCFAASIPQSHKRLQKQSKMKYKISIHKSY